jgi:hypothetical protein
MCAQAVWIGLHRTVAIIQFSPTFAAHRSRPICHGPPVTTQLSFLSRPTCHGPSVTLPPRPPVSAYLSRPICHATCSGHLFRPTCHGPSVTLPTTATCHGFRGMAHMYFPTCCSPRGAATCYHSTCYNPTWYNPTWYNLTCFDSTLFSRDQQRNLT